MARPLSWLDRLHTIARTVDGSSRSHYDRKDLEELFAVQSRSAQNLMAAMPVVSVGNAHLVEREALSAFLHRLDEAENPTEAFTRLRAKPPKRVRRELRALSLKDVSADLNCLPEALTLSRGVMTVHFQTVDQLAETMVCVAALLQDHLEEFSLRFEPPSAQSEKNDREEEEIRSEVNYLKVRVAAQSNRTV